MRAAYGTTDELTWNKVQHLPVTISETQAYAVRQIDALAENIESKAKLGDLARNIADVDVLVREWLAVLARCYQLLDSVAVLELDRAVETHRRGLAEARSRRLETIGVVTELLLTRTEAAAPTEHAKVFLHPATCRAIVDSSNSVGEKVTALHETVGIASEREQIRARRRVEAVADVCD